MENVNIKCNIESEATLTGYISEASSLYPEAAISTGTFYRGENSYLRVIKHNLNGTPRYIYIRKTDEYSPPSANEDSEPTLFVLIGASYNEDKSDNIYVRFSLRSFSESSSYRRNYYYKGEVEKYDNIYYLIRNVNSESFTLPDHAYGNYEWMAIL